MYAYLVHGKRKQHEKFKSDTILIILDQNMYIIL